MLIVFPLGLLATAVVFDLVDLATGTGAFALAAYWITAAGVVAGLGVVPFGFLDWLHMPDGTRAKRLAALQGAGNLAMVVLFAVSWLLREPEGDLPVSALLLALLGAAIATLPPGRRTAKVN